LKLESAAVTFPEYQDLTAHW